ncbi:MAG TPA: lipopolysaccharide biosynthesis protein [Longimicrobium sp.]
MSAREPVAARAGTPDGEEARGLRGLMKGSAAYGMGAIASRFVGLLLLPVYTRLFTPAEFGLLELLTTTSVLLFMLAELQILSGVARGYYAAAAAGELPRLLGTAVRMYLRNAIAWTALAPPLLFALGGRMEGIGGWTVLLPVVLAVFPQQLLALSQLIFRFERRPGLFVAFSLCDVATSAAFSLVAVVGAGMGVPGVLWGLFFSKLVWGGAAVWIRRELFAWHYDRARARELLYYGVPMLPAVLSRWGQNSASRYVLALSLSLADLGVFGVAARVSAVVAILDTAFRASWDPMAMRLFEEEGSEPVFVRVLGMYLAGMFAVCSMLAFVGGMLTGFVAGPAYEAAGPLLGFLAFGLLWNGAAGMMGAGNAWARRTYWNALGFAGGAVLNVLLLLWAAPRWGVAAAGATYLVSTLACAGLVLATAHRSHPIPYRLLAILSAAVGSCVVAAAAYALDRSASFAALAPATQLAVRLALGAAGALPLAGCLLRRLALQRRARSAAAAG